MADQPQKTLVDMDAWLRRAFEAGRPRLREKAESNSASRRAIHLLIAEAVRESSKRMESELQRRRAEVTAPKLNREFLEGLRTRYGELNQHASLLDASSVRVRTFSGTSEPPIQEGPINLGPTAIYQYGVAEAKGSGLGWSDSLILQAFLISPIVFLPLALDGSGDADAGAATAAYWFEFTPPADGEYEFRSLVMALGTFEIKSADAPWTDKEAKAWVGANLSAKGQAPEDSFYAEQMTLFNRRVAKVAEMDQVLGIGWVEASSFCRGGVKLSLLVDLKAVAYARGDESYAKVDLSQANGGCFVCTGVWVTKIG